MAHYLSGFKVQTYDSTFRVEYLLRENKNPAHPKQNRRKWKEKEERNLTLCSTTSVQFSCSVVFNTLWAHEWQHARPPCPSPTPGVYTYSCSLSWWCHPTISFSVISFSSFPQSFLTSGFFKWVSSLHHVAEVLEFQLQHWSFQWTFRTDFL